MPGENTLPVEHYPDDFRVVTYHVETTPSDKVVVYCDRNMVVDSISYSISAAGAASSTATLKAVAPGTAPTGANVAAGTAVSNALAVDATGVVFGTIVNTENQLLAGTHLGIDYTGTVTNLRGVIQIRLRSRLK